MPKFDRCASPHSWAVRPVLGWRARSPAITPAPPRKKANGEVSMRLWRSGTSSWRREGISSASTWTGSGRPVVLSSAWVSAGTRVHLGAQTRPRLGSRGVG